MTVCAIDKNRAEKRLSVGNGVAPLIRTVSEVVIDKVVVEQRSEGGRAVEKSGRRVFQVGKGQVQRP